jgi:hypothetical protein
MPDPGFFDAIIRDHDRRPAREPRDPALHDGDDRDIT